MTLNFPPNGSEGRRRSASSWFSPETWGQMGGLQERCSSSGTCSDWLWLTDTCGEASGSGVLPGAPPKAVDLKAKTRNQVNFILLSPKNFEKIMDLFSRLFAGVEKGPCASGATLCRALPPSAAGTLCFQDGRSVSSSSAAAELDPEYVCSSLSHVQRYIYLQ